MHARLRGTDNLLILHQIINRPNFPCLADEIAEPRPDMNTKVVAFTISEKSINNWQVLPRMSCLKHCCPYDNFFIISISRSTVALWLNARLEKSNKTNSYLPLEEHF